MDEPWQFLQIWGLQDTKAGFSVGLGGGGHRIILSREDLARISADERAFKATRKTTGAQASSPAVKDFTGKNRGEGACAPHPFLFPEFKVRDALLNTQY